MSLLDKLLGRHPRTAVAIAAEIAARKAILSDARLRASTAVARKAAALDAQDANALKAVEDDADAARRDAELAVHAIDALEAAHGEQVEREAANVLTARRNAAERRLVAEAPKMLADYDRLAAQLATVLNGLREIETEALVVNEALHRAGRRDEALENIQRRYRFEAGKQDPDRVEFVEEWHERDTNGSFSRAVQLVRDKETGEMVPRNGGKKVKREVRHPGRKRRDTYLPSLHDISLPAGRLGGVQHWPRG